MKVPKARKLKSGNWFIQLRLDGTSVPVTAATERECTRQAALIKAEHRAGKNCVTPKCERTLGEILQAYIDQHEAVLSPSTIRSYDCYRRTRFAAYRNEPVGKIKDWQAVVNAEVSNVGAKTLKNAWAFVRCALKEEAGIIANAKLPQVPIKDVPFLQPEEIIPFCDAVRGNIVEIPALLELHGLRRSEALGLDWKDVDLRRSLLHVRGSVVQNKDGAFVKKNTNKNATSTRTVPIMIPQLADALAAVENKTGAVVQIAANTMLRNVKEVCRKNGLTVVGNHGLRHSFASLAYHLGISERQLMELGGWADYMTMHKIYIRIAAADKRAAQNAISDFFRNQGNANKKANQLQQGV